MDEELLFTVRNPCVTEWIGMQHYDAEADRYYSVTRIDEVGGVYSVFGVSIEMPELTDDEPRSE